MNKVKNSFLDTSDLPSRPHKRIYGLWLSPKIDVDGFCYQVPTIPHAEFDYNRLGKLLGSLFWQFNQSKLLVCNDNIDAITFDDHIAQRQVMKKLADDEPFEKFGKAVSRNSNKNIDGVIDLRSSSAWMKLKSRASCNDHVYPPQILPFCVLTKNEMDSNWWHVLAKGEIKNSPFEGIARSFAGKPPIERPTNYGVLPVWALEELSDIYQVMFEPKVMLERMIPNPV